MAMVRRWTGRETRALRDALRLSVRAFAARLGVSPRTVANWEAPGSAVRPRPEMQAALDTAPGRATHDEKTRFNLIVQGGGDQGEEESATKRRQFLAGALGATGLALIGTADGGVHLQTADDEQLLMIASATYRRLEQRLASRALVAPVAAHLGFVSELASIRGGSTAQRLHMVVSETAGLAAWLYVDLDDRANARRHYQLAIRSADLTGHPLLPAYMQASLGQFAATSGDALQGLRLIGQARNRLPKAAPGVASVWLDTLEAVALAELRDQAALKLLDDAERRLAKASDSEAVWPWIFRFDEPKLAGYRAVAAAKLGRTRLAERAFEVAGAVPQAPKQRAVMELAHARALASGGEVEKACAVAAGAFDAGAALGSARVIHEVAAFRSALGNRAGQAVSELADRLHATYQEGM
jgi:transcriptional regulator with XRE-family HTH domain